MVDPAADAQVRAYTRADRDAVLELQARVFGAAAATGAANWAWEYDDNPFQVPGVPLGWIAEIDGRMAGYYGMLPLRLCVDGRFVLALCGADFCVDETYRGRGLGTLLTRYLLQAAKGHRLFATSATPTAAHLLKKAGLSFVDVTSEPSLWACGDCSGGVPGAGGVGSADLGDAGLRAGLDAFAHELARHHRIVLWRGADYLAWRYGAYPIATAMPIVRARRCAASPCCSATAPAAAPTCSNCCTAPTTATAARSCCRTRWRWPRRTVCASSTRSTACRRRGRCSQRTASSACRRVRSCRCSTCR
jgi:GNAT superfamily N-acetyltransferase